MKLTIKDVSMLLKVSEKLVQDWIYNEELPAYKMNGQFRINKSELRDWAISRKFSIDAMLFQKEKPAYIYSLTKALEYGGIYYNIVGSNKLTVFEAIVELIKVPGGLDRNNLVQILMAREALASTGIGNGIAIPHVRNPIIVPVPYPSITLCFLEKPIHFDALDKKPVHTLFVTLSPNIHSHLFLLSRLTFALNIPEFKMVIDNREDKMKIMGSLYEVENKIGFPSKLN